MLKKVFALSLLFLFYVSNCFAVIEYAKYDSLVSYYGNNIDKTPLSLLENYKKDGVSYQEFFDYLLAFADFNLFYTNMKCKKDLDNTDCLRIIAKIEAVVDELPFFAKYNNQKLDTNKFKEWKENALNGKPTFDLLENSKDWKYITIVLDKTDGIPTSPTP